MSNELLRKKTLLLYGLFLLSGVAYYWLAYHTARENFLQVLSLFTFLFAAHFVEYKFFSTTHFKHLLIAGILFRMLLLFSIPNLSEDVYRFIWDGRLAANGINPFSYLPAEIMQMPPIKGITMELFGQLNSQNNYTIYPPVLQGIFWLAAKLFPLDVYAAIVFMKSVMVIAEGAIFFLLMQLLNQLTLPKHLSLLYILNPLVITELTGNAHFDGIMILFVLLAFLFIIKNKWQGSAICLGLGVASKLVPILFLPLIINILGWKKGLLYSFLTAITTFVLFAVLFDVVTAQHLLNSIDLYFRKFEFNASVYYITRWIGTMITGYNIIALAGPVLYSIATGIILFLSFRDRNKPDQLFFSKALFIITIWYLFSTTIHPWYLCLPIALAVLTPYRFAIIWSFTAVLSYAAYQSDPVHENLWLIAAGYIFMFGYAWWEIKSKQTNNT